MHEGLAPSPWITRWAHLIARGGTVLDVACGHGRHFRWLAAQGFAVTGIDRDASALRPLAAFGETIVADIESGTWPLAGRRFDAVVITNYLWRPLTPTLVGALAADGVYLHETFAIGQEEVGRPARAEFLLRRRELISIAEGLRIVAYEDGWLGGGDGDPLRCVQRIVARAGPGGQPSLGG